ncbi:hypothetical protein [Paenibacillus sp. IHBB 10380]|uniref:hypothetical protein n=1 Tax=Paenibacillus sp. IHBB 10380 TaxID=1566358 RepID=UPI000B01EFAD|nr:hypothetical protein [Paenibacillus sp. IHBB 10380]
MPQHYYYMFQKGSMPSAWTEEPPSFAEVIDRLRRQVNDIITAADGKLNDVIAQRLLKAD